MGKTNRKVWRASFSSVLLISSVSLPVRINACIPVVKAAEKEKGANRHNKDEERRTKKELRKQKNVRYSTWILDIFIEII